MRFFCLFFRGEGGDTTWPTINKLIELEAKVVVLAPALSPKDMCSLMALNQEKVILKIKIIRRVFCRNR